MANGPEIIGSGEYRSSPTVRTALVDGINFTNKALRYSEINGLAIFEGDIVLGRVEEVEAGTELRRQVARSNRFLGDVITGDWYRWPGGVVPYEIDPAVPAQERITDAIAHWHQKTAIRFVPRNDSHPDFVRFVEDDGCVSNVGRQGGQQNIGLQQNCGTGAAIHELFHAVGAWHEQSREDRDLFVVIKWENIEEQHKHNFDQHVTDNDDVGPYDYDSIMHYSRKAFSANGEDTIVPVRPEAHIGQREGLSYWDVEAVRWLYPDLAKWSTKENVKDDPKEGVKDDPKDGVKDDPKDGAKDDPKDRVKDDPKEGFKDKEDPLKPFPGAFGETTLEPMRAPDLGRLGRPGATPFVLGTGQAPPGSVRSGMTRGGGQPPHAALLADYQRLLATFVALHAAGGLNARARVAWRQTAAAYAQLIGGLP